jgi:hypothetical protein
VIKGDKCNTLQGKMGVSHLPDRYGHKNLDQELNNLAEQGFEIFSMKRTGIVLAHFIAATIMLCGCKQTNSDATSNNISRRIQILSQIRYGI